MYQKYVKRIIDVMVVLIVSVFTLPVTVFVAIVIKLESRGPVFFKQKRTGLNGEKFTLYKFRSMSSENDVRDLSKADKFTKSGVVIRLLSIDELPQFINILKGEMSIIGPRPWIPDYYDNMSMRQRRRNDVLPGITGLAQAYGRNSLTINQKTEYDLEYVVNISLREDIRIILATIKSIFDTSTQEMGKHSIKSEIDTLARQNATFSTDIHATNTGHAV